MQLEQLKNTAHFRRISQPAQQLRPADPKAANSDFKKLLEQEQVKSGHNVKFSAHATERLAARNIVLTNHELTRLDRAVSKVAEKGSKESLVVMGNLSFVVSVENRTVITAMQNQPNGNDKVFTNIDSALLM